MQAMIQVFLVDDHIILLDGLKKVIDESGVAEVTGMATNGTECLSALQANVPDVLMLDIRLPDINGIDLCRTIRETHPSIRIVALTSFCEYAVVHEIMAQGASGYVIKNALPEEIIRGIQTVYEGKTFLCEQIKLLMHRKQDNSVWLTNREKQLLSLIVEGFTNTEIAEKMFLGVETINSYRKNLLCKLGARNTAVLVRKALEDKLI